MSFISDWNFYLDYIETLYRKYPGFLEIPAEEKKRRDLTFSAKDIIRFYNFNLDLNEKEEVKDFFAEIMTHVVTEIQNSQIWQQENSEGLEPTEMSVQSLQYLNNWDLITETTKYLYSLLDVIRDIATLPFDPYSYARLWLLYKEGVILVNNWMKYYDRLTKIYDVQIGSDPWWSYDQFYGNIEY